MAGPQIGSEDVNPDPMEPENRLHQYNYKPNSDPKKEAVIRIEARKLPGRLGEMPSDLAGRRQERNEQAQRKPHQAGRTDRGTVLRISPDDLVRLAPRLRSYLAKGSPSWVDIVDAADWLRHDLGVSKPLWGEACLAMGREEAAIALAVVSTKPVEHFRSSPGGYFYGMVSRARAGELNLGRTLWGLRLGQEKPGVNGRKGAALDVAHG